MTDLLDKTIQLNGAPAPLTATTLAALLEERAEEVPRRGIAIALNGTVVPRAAWPRTPLHPGDRVEIVRVMQGG